jgi:hypothetical protein
MFALFVKFIGRLSKYLRTTLRDLIANIGRLDPLDCILYNALNIRIVEGSAKLVTGLEIKDLSKTAGEAASASENISVLIPSAENKSVGLGDIEGLAIKLLLFNNEVIGNTCRYWVRGHKIPDYLLLIASPREISRSADHRLKYL